MSKESRSFDFARGGSAQDDKAVASGWWLEKADPSVAALPRDDKCNFSIGGGT